MEQTVPNGLIDYVNVPAVIGSIVSSKLATLNELQTVYGIEDAYDLLEIINVNSYNQRAVEKWQQSTN